VGRGGRPPGAGAGGGAGAAEAARGCAAPGDRGGASVAEGCPETALALSDTRISAIKIPGQSHSIQIRMDGGG